MVCTLSKERSAEPALQPEAGVEQLEHLGALDMSSAAPAAEQRRAPPPPAHLHHHHHHQLLQPARAAPFAAEPAAARLFQQHQQREREHEQQSMHQDDRSSSAGSSTGSCSPPRAPVPQSAPSQSPPAVHARPPWLHEFASPHVLQFLNLNAAAAGSMLAASQPLAALHSMAERSQQQQSQQGQGSPTGSGKHSPATSITSVGSNPHGIDTILSRPAPAQPGPGQPPQQSTPGSQHHLAPAPRYAMHAGFAASTGIGQFQQRAEPRHPAIYWPGLQGLVSDPLGWRARLHSLSQQLGCQQQAMSGGGGGGSVGSDHEPGKKKHTRPTFSGQQIFALEKTFEQTKYLAGPERAKLAYALGMSESQVKVWFQNRRTKWRKKHAAEMATAKRRQEEVEGVAGDVDDGCSDPEVGQELSSGSTNNGDSAAKRLRRELGQQY